MGVQDGLRAFAEIRRPAGQAVKQNRCQRIHIGRGSHRAPEENLLGRRVGDGSDEPIGLAEASRRNALGDAEIGEIGMSSVTDDDVLGFDVAVDDVERVRGIKGVGDRHQQADRLLCRQTAGVHAIRERRSAHELHRKKQPSVDLIGIVNRDYVWVVELGGGPALAQEALPEGVITRNGRCDHLQRDFA